MTHAPAEVKPNIWWLVPARLAARYHRGIAAVVEPDIEMLEHTPWPTWWPWIVVGVTLLYSFLRFGIHDVYTESRVFLAAALALGFISPVLGVLLVALHSGLDLLRSLSFSLGVPARLIGDWLLWLYVVELPLLVRAAEPAVARYAARTTVQNKDRLQAAVLAALSIGLTIVWALGVPILLRPVFTWSHRVPTNQAYDWVQRAWYTISFIAAAACVAGSWVRRRWGTAAAPAADRSAAAPPAPRARFVALVLFVIAMSGMVTSATDVLFLVAAYLLVGRAAEWAVGFPVVARLVRGAPRAVRMLVAFVVTYVAARIITGMMFRNVYVTEFFPVVLSVCVGIVVFGILLDAERFADPARPRAGMRANLSDAARAVVLGAAMLLTPRLLFANNCSDRSDCYGSEAAAAAAAAGAAAAGGFGGGGGRPPE